jgi:hypothetical protein
MHFETGCIKLIRADDEEPNDEERIALSCLKVENEVREIFAPESVSVDAPNSLSARLEAFKKKKRKLSVVQAADYMDPAFIAATSVVCEWFFSMVGYTLDDRRKGLLPKNLEMQLFLKVNSAFWDVEKFFKAVKEYMKENSVTLDQIEIAAQNNIEFGLDDC